MGQKQKKKLQKKASAVDHGHEETEPEREEEGEVSDLPENGNGNGRGSLDHQPSTGSSMSARTPSFRLSNGVTIEPVPLHSHSHGHSVPVLLDRIKALEDQLMNLEPVHLELKIVGNAQDVALAEKEASVQHLEAERIAQQEKGAQELRLARQLINEIDAQKSENARYIDELRKDNEELQKMITDLLKEHKEQLTSLIKSESMAKAEALMASSRVTQLEEEKRVLSERLAEALCDLEAKEAEEAAPSSSKSHASPQADSHPHPSLPSSSLPNAGNSSEFYVSKETALGLLGATGVTGLVLGSLVSGMLRRYRIL